VANTALCFTCLDNEFVPKIPRLVYRMFEDGSVGEKGIHFLAKVVSNARGGILNEELNRSVDVGIVLEEVGGIGIKGIVSK